MAKDKPEELSRRDFIGLALGSALVAGIGCTTESNTSEPSGVGGTPGGNGGTPGTDTTDTESGQGGTATTTKKTGNGGTSATSSKSDSSKGGTSSKSGSVAEGGAAESGGNSNSGGSSASSKSGSSSAQGGSTSSKSGASSATGGNSTGGSSSVGGESRLVCLVRNAADPRQAALDAIAGAGGLPDLSGRTVVLKLNLLNVSAPPCTTSAQVVLGVVQAVKARNAARIVVGDASMRTSATAVMNSSSTGIHAALAAEGVEEVDFTAQGKSGVTLVKPAGANDWPNGFNVWNAVLDDGSGQKPFVINMPCCKHHGMATWSLAMKNWIGILPYGEVAGVGDSSVPNERNAAHRVLTSGLPELHLAVKEDFVILDAMKIQLTGGPGNGAADTQASAGIVVATKDAVAAEATGLCLLREYRKRMSRIPAKDDIENLKIFNTDPTTLMGRALTLGNGWIKSRNEYTYKAVDLDADEELIMAHLDA